MERLIAGLVAVIGAGMLACAGTPVSAQTTTEINVATYEATAESLKSDGRTWKDAEKLPEGADVTLPDGTQKALPKGGTVWELNKEYVVAKMAEPKTIYVEQQCKHPTTKRYVSCSSIVEEQLATIAGLNEDIDDAKKELKAEKSQSFWNMVLVLAILVLVVVGGVMMAPTDGLSHTFGAQAWHDFKTWNAGRKRRAQLKKERTLTSAPPQGA